MNRARVVLTAGFDRAMNVLTLADLLRRSDVAVEGVLVVSPYSWKRLRLMLRQRGRSILWNSIPRMLGVGKRAVAAGESTDGVTALMQKHHIEPQSLTSWTRTHGVRHRVVKSINDVEATAFVTSIEPDWVVYGGGGILRRVFIDAADGRILNAHSGPLPEVRGMNACEWSLLLGYAPAVTIHLINRGIDTGGAIDTQPVPVLPGDTIEALRSRCVAMGIEALYRTISDPPKILPQPLENASSNRQCFVLAPALKEILARRLAMNRYKDAPCHAVDESDPA